VWPSLDETALRFGDESVTYGELLVIGAATGLLERARAETSRATHALKTHATAIGQDDVRREAEAFRRKRKLHSGDDLRTWLEGRGVDEKQWTRYLRRSLALTLGAEPDGDSVTDDETEEALIIDLACGGWWGRVADEATRLWSAERAESRHGSPQGSRAQGSDNATSRHIAIESAAKRVAESVPTLGVLDVERCAKHLQVFEARRQALADLIDACSDHQVVARRIDEHSVDWAEFVYEEVRLPNRSSANEAAMCAREDGLSAGEVASRAGVALERRELRRDEIPTGIAAMLTGAVPGDVLGPFDEDDGVHVVWLRDRRAPSIDDPKTREAAIAEIVSEQLDRAAAGRALVMGPL
jgi:hypothetical protein